MAQFMNTANVNGEYEGMPVGETTQASVELTAIGLAKSTDKPVWVTDPLIYTITATNLDDRDPADPTNPGLPVEDVVVTDQIDSAIAIFDEASLTVTVGGTAITPVYTYVEDLLTVTIGTLAPGEDAVITFQVTKA